MNYYYFNGLYIKSEIPLVPLTPSPSIKVDVTISLAKVPTQLVQPIMQEATFMLKRDEALIMLPGIARMLITNGSNISIELDSNCPANDLSVFILTIAWAALSYQRGRNLLKGSLIELNNQAWLISGVSPIGSSTFALAMHKYLDAKVTSDEFCSYYHTDKGIMVEPGISALKLWHNSLDFFNIDSSNLSKVRTQLHKFWLPLSTTEQTSNAIPTSPLRLTGIISLQQWRSDELSPIGLQYIKGFKALKKTHHHGFHRVYLNGQHLWQQRFEEGLKLAQSCKLTTYTFKREMRSLRESCLHLQEQINK